MNNVTENHNRRKERNPECYNCGRSLKMEEETEFCKCGCVIHWL